MVHSKGCENNDCCEGYAQQNMTHISRSSVIFPGQGTWFQLVSWMAQSKHIEATKCQISFWASNMSMRAGLQEWKLVKWLLHCQFSGKEKINSFKNFTMTKEAMFCCSFHPEITAETLMDYVPGATSMTQKHPRNGTIVISASAKIVSSFRRHTPHENLLYCFKSEVSNLHKQYISLSKSKQIISAEYAGFNFNSCTVFCFFLFWLHHRKITCPWVLPWWKWEGIYRQKSYYKRWQKMFKVGRPSQWNLLEGSKASVHARFVNGHFVLSQKFDTCIYLVG